MEQEKLFMDWFDKYQGVIIKIARSFTSSADDFDDLYQEIIIQIWKSTVYFRGESSAMTWVYKVAINRATLWKKRESKRLELIKSIDLPSALLKMDDDHPDHFEYLYQGIRKLNKIDRSLILLVLDEVSHKEISQIMGLSEPAVGVRIHRVKKKLLGLIKRD
ncbi:RNA polymerase sigma factor [Hyunsoonleella rubra]|uniref:RNA polymerase sigma factor n=1 Tax=Hyunsoonleella rubra TaxID=1737062 RepID=A0ABW5T8R1_9FLAO